VEEEKEQRSASREDKMIKDSALTWPVQASPKAGSPFDNGCYSQSVLAVSLFTSARRRNRFHKAPS
jgi:hypothetical protein